MSKLLRSAVMFSCVVHGTVATHAAEERERPPGSQGGGALMESLTLAKPHKDADLDLAPSAGRKRQTHGPDWSDHKPSASRSRARREPRGEATARARGEPRIGREKSLNAPQPSSGPHDSDLLRAVDAVASGLRDRAFPFSRPQPAAALPKPDAAPLEAPGVALGGGPLLYRLDLTRMYGQEAWVKPLLVPQYVIMPEPLVRSSRELPRPIVDEIHALVPAPSSLSLAAAAAVVYGAARAGARRLRRAARP